MSFKILDHSGRQRGLPGEKSHIYTVNAYGASGISTMPLATTALRSTTLSIAANSTWVNVPFDTAIVPPDSPSLWDTGSALVVPESDWYTISGSIAFASGQSGDTYQGFMIWINTLNFALYSGRVYVPGQYSFQITEEFTMYLTAGSGFWMNVCHTGGSARTLAGGASLSCSRVGA